MTQLAEKIELMFHRRSLRILLVILSFVFVTLCVSASIFFIYYHEEQEVTHQKLNILFIVADDLRPTLGCYGDSRAITPNIDQLAKKSVLFTNAFAQQALCAPSRTSFLTSRRPDTLHLYDNTGSYWREAVWNFTTLPEHFKNNGYETISIGKVFHHGKVSNKVDDFPFSWSKMPFHPSSLKEKMAKVCPTLEGERMNLVCPVDVNKQPDRTLPDIEVAEYAVEYLNNRSKNDNGDQPFFLGVGFYKPHIPFKFPVEYLDLYPIDTMDTAQNNTKPEGMPDVAWNPWMDLRERDDVKELNVKFPYGPIPEDFQKRIRQGYYASVSYMDDQLGKILEALQTSGYASNTVIVFFGDHGWSLGEHGEWAKYSNFDVALNVPLLIFIPNLTGGVADEFKHIHVTELKQKNYTSSAARYTADEFVELVDLFPTLAEIAKLNIPFVCPLHSHNTSFCSEGISLYPVILNQIHWFKDLDWKTAVYAQYPRPSSVPSNNSDQPVLEDIHIMGYTMKNEYFRYTRWVSFNNSFFVPYWSAKYFVSDELYDVDSDPFELDNLARESQYNGTRRHYFNLLKKGWRSALPDEIFGSP